jgi:hypothetical protein
LLRAERKPADAAAVKGGMCLFLFLAFWDV